MIKREPECVILKRQGAEHVAQLLKGKTRQEEADFWRKRTARLRSLKNKALQSHNKSAAEHRR